MYKRTIMVILPEFGQFDMVIDVPENRDDVEYIYEFLQTILADYFQRDFVWDFVDGLS